MTDTTKRVDVDQMLGILIDNAYRDGDCNIPCMSDQTLQAKAALLLRASDLTADRDSWRRLAERLEAERLGAEAKLAERDADIERLKEQKDKFMWQVRDTCTRAEAAEHARDEAIQNLRIADEWLDNAPHGNDCFVYGYYEDHPDNRCNCGRDSAINLIAAFLAANGG